ncbi:alanine dehydrogenase [Paenimyroides viscosum]|uniref:alanine dehydrogenase n=1 Tax=Paenimyroides viscosum TaxID=2488729 RepID=A0A3P1B752_9FLAO|nr:alanine dehydrogenase [Paenimyroides viscosum]RRA96947.1 alanine dehydrogenase [Paenimyroides viscosum]
MDITSPFSKSQLIPQEEKLEIRRKRGQLFIGIPKEDFKIEKRICLTPESVNMLVKAGHKVLMEAGAGTEASYDDKKYSEAGATITHDKEKVFGCPIILKVDPPTINEIRLMKPKTYLFSALQLKTQKKEYFEALEKKKITALCYEFIKDRYGAYPFLHAISEIAGIASIQIASDYMCRMNGGKGLLFGNITGVPPTEVVIIGAGLVGEAAVKTALALGVNVKVFDNNIHKLKRLQKSLPTQIFTSTIQERVLTKALMRCDVAIGAIKGCNRSPIVISEEMVQRMKPGSVIIDVCIDNGGCFETSEVTTHENPVITKYGVIHYGVPNITAKYSKTASLAISNIISPYLLDLTENGSIDDAISYDNTIRSGIYMYKGILVNEPIAKWFNLPFKDLNLIFL